MESGSEQEKEMGWLAVRTGLLFQAI